MSVSKMADGRWYASCRYTTWQGERKQKKKEGFQTKREAQAWEREFLNTVHGNSDMTMSSLFDLYLQSQKPRIKESTYRTIESLINARFRPVFGKLKCSEVTPAVIHDWHSSLLTGTTKYNKPFSVTVLRNMNIKLSSIFNFGMKFYGLKTNPCKLAGQVTKPKQRTISFLTLDEFNRFLAVEKRADCRLAFQMLFWLGLREGELLALTPADILDNSVSVTKTYLHMKSGDKITTPKTEKSVREISCPAFLMKLINDYIKGAKDIQNDDRIFETIAVDVLRSHCVRNCERADVPRIRVHDLRHSHASLLINQGASPVLIAKRLGHSKVDTTLNIYSHLYPSQEDNLMAMLDNCYDSVTTKSDGSNFDT